MGTKSKPSGGNQEDLKETLARLDSEIEKSPEDINLYHIKIALLMEAGCFEEAIADMDKVLKIDPNDTKTLHDRGLILFKFGRFHEALECYNKAVEIDNDLTKAWLGRGITLLKLRKIEFEDDFEVLDKERKIQLEDAIDSLTVVTDRTPASLPAWNGKGYALYILHRFEEARECFEKCIIIDSDFINAWYGKGKTLTKLDKKNEAVIAFQTALDCMGKNDHIKDIDTMICIANSYLELQQNSEAIDCVNKFLEKEPHNPLALAFKGDILERIGRGSEAQICYKKSLELDPTGAYVWYKLGNIQNELSEFEGAIESYKKAVQIISGFEEAWYDVGELLKLQNNNEKARKCFSWILKLNPDNAKAKRAMSNLTESKEVKGSLGKMGTSRHKELNRRKKRKRKKPKNERAPESPKKDIKSQSGSRKPIQKKVQQQKPISKEDIGAKKSDGNTICEPKYDKVKNPQKVECTKPKVPEPEGRDGPESDLTDDYILHALQVELEKELNEFQNPSVEEEFPQDLEQDLNNLNNELDAFAELSDKVPTGTEKIIKKKIQGRENYSHGFFGEVESKIEDEFDSYGDLDESLNELERLLMEKSDNDMEHEEVEPKGKLQIANGSSDESKIEISNSDFIDSDDQSLNINDSVRKEDKNLEINDLEFPRLKEGNPNTQENNFAEPEEHIPSLEDLEEHLDALQAFLVDESAHLDGQKIQDAYKQEAHLDGHPIKGQMDHVKMDAHSKDYIPPDIMDLSLEKLVNQGKIYMDRGEFKKAMACFDKALELDPQCTDAMSFKWDLMIKMDTDQENQDELDL